MAATEKQVGGNHYKGMAIQPMEYNHKNGLGPCESSVVKYISRHKSKNGKQDILKAIHCLELLIQFEYPEADASEGNSGTRSRVLLEGFQASEEKGGL